MVKSQVAFGRPFISNPDLPERFANNWPLAADPDYSTWYSSGAKGYIDWPVYAPPAGL
jgi:2,4-dienoyl-CoA reductase-like NADH-dependent reductase (Old Yellow Enzyme family)